MTSDLRKDERITRLKTPAECEQFAQNVADRPPLVLAAKRRAVELKAESHNPATQIEREALAALYAYEQVLSEKRGKRVRASRTWQMIKRHGIIGAVERAVDRPDDPQGYRELVALNMPDLAFEAIVLRHPDEFSSTAVERSRKRLEGWSNVTSP